MKLDDPNNPYFRYATDHWYFAMLLTSGDVIGFSHIHSIEGEYIRISALEQHDITGPFNQAFGKTICGVPTDRTDVLVRESSIVAICEIANT